ncbi:hypothetical protein Tco_1031735 [Tanacetum coccineum]|uniref:Reverse transcriptase/retrotransposon-derived protein RNase H-like domain-containing protein n=1 Tax=Tanacetum coccineum TaxID=301880 RepID=A0ABQ5GAN2_9ASTR
MSMTIQSDVKDKILATPSETSKVENAPAEMLRDLDQQMEKRVDDGNIVTDALSRKERVKPRRVRAMAMTIQYGIEMDDLPRGFGRRCRMLLVVTIRFGVLLVSFKAAWDKVNVRVIMLMNSIYLNVDESTFLCDLSFILWTSISQHPRLELRVEVQRINQMLIPTFVPWWLIPYLMVVNISFPRKVVEKVGLEAVLEGGPWMIRNSPIILKKWSMDTRLLKEELTLEFRVDLVLGAMPVAKSLYRLAPLEMQELSEQLQEFQDEGAWSSFEVSVGSIEEGEAVTYLRFIKNFSKFVKPLTPLTERNQKYEWGAEREKAFQTLKNDLCDASINQMQWLMR